MQEDIADLDKRVQKRDGKEWALVVLTRTVANLAVLVILIGAGWAHLPGSSAGSGQRESHL